MRVPTQIVPRTQPSGGGLGYFDANASPEAFGAPIARGLGALGGVLMQEEERLAREAEVEAERERARLEREAEAQKRFKTMLALSEFESNVRMGAQELKYKAAPDGQGHLGATQEYFRGAGETFIKERVPPELQDEFRLEIDKIRQGVEGDAFNFEIKARHEFATSNLTLEMDKARKALDFRAGGDSSAASQVAWTQKMFNLIEATPGLTEGEKLEWKRKATIALATVAYESENVAEIVRQLEGVRTAGGGFRLKGPIGDVIDQAAAEYGVDPTTLHVIAYLESSGNPRAVSPTGPVGLFQFTQETAREYGVLDRRNPIQSARGAARMARDAISYLSKVLGREPQPGEVYLAHQQGMGGAKALLSNPTAAVGSVVKPSAVVVNGGNLGMTAGEFASLWINKAHRVAGREPVETDPRFNAVPYEDRVGIYDRAYQTAQSLIAEQEQQRAAAERAAIDALQISVVRGEAGRSELEAAYDSGLLHRAEDYTRTLNLIEEREAAGRDLAEAKANYANPGFVFTAENQKQMNLLANDTGDGGVSVVQRLAAADPQGVEALIPMVKRFQDIPTDAMAMLTTLFRDRNPARMNFAADALMQLYEVDQRMFRSRANEQVERDLLVWDTMKDVGYSDGQIAERLLGGSVADAGRTQALREQAEKWLSEEDGGKTELESIVEDLLGEFPSDWVGQHVYTPGWASVVQEEFTTIFLQEYPRYMDPEKTRDAAIKILQRNWDSFRMNHGTQVMKFPPHKVGYPALAGGWEWVESAIRQQFAIPEGRKVYIYSDSQTEREAAAFREGKGPLPSYRAFWQDEFGVFHETEGRTALRPPTEEIARESRRRDRELRIERLQAIVDRYKAYKRAVGYAGEDGALIILGSTREALAGLEEDAIRAAAELTQLAQDHRYDLPADQRPMTPEEQRAAHRPKQAEAERRAAEIVQKLEDIEAAEREALESETAWQEYESQEELLEGVAERIKQKYLIELQQSQEELQRVLEESELEAARRQRMEELLQELKDKSLLLRIPGFIRRLLDEPEPIEDVIGTREGTPTEPAPGRRAASGVQEEKQRTQESAKEAAREARERRKAEYQEDEIGTRELSGVQEGKPPLFVPEVLEDEIGTREGTPTGPILGTRQQSGVQEEKNARLAAQREVAQEARQRHAASVGEIGTRAAPGVQELKAAQQAEWFKRLRENSLLGRLSGFLRELASQGEVLEDEIGTREGTPSPPSVGRRAAPGVQEEKAMRPDPLMTQVPEEMPIEGMLTSPTLQGRPKGKVLVLKEQNMMILVPGTVAGKELTRQEAEQRFMVTGEHWGIFDSDYNAQLYLKWLTK